jgi:hypothetical protein
LQNSCEWNRSLGEFVLERSSSETQRISVAMERWSVEHRVFAVETIIKKQRFCRCDSVDISLALQYSSEGVFLVAILFLWGHLKSKVHEKKPRTTVDLKQNIREEVAAISPNMLQ